MKVIIINLKVKEDKERDKFLIIQILCCYLLFLNFYSQIPINKVPIYNIFKTEREIWFIIPYYKEEIKIRTEKNEIKFNNK